MKEFDGHIPNLGMLEPPPLGTAIAHRQTVTFEWRTGWSNKVCRSCSGLLDFIYSTFWKCRTCNKWHSIVPKA